LVHRRGNLADLRPDCPARGRRAHLHPDLVPLPRNRGRGCAPRELESHPGAARRRDPRHRGTTRRRSNRLVAAGGTRPSPRRGGQEHRAAGRLDWALQAALVRRVGGEGHGLPATLDGGLRFVTIPSAARLEPAAAGAEAVIEVSPSTKPKCERWWHYRDDVGA